MFEYRTCWPQANETDDYLDAMDAEDWELVHFIPLPRLAPGAMLYVLTLHRRAIPPEEEATHLARLSKREAA